MLRSCVTDNVTVVSLIAVGEIVLVDPLGVVHGYLASSPPRCC